MALTQALILYLIILISVAVIILLMIASKINRKNKNILKELTTLKREVKHIKQAEKELAGVLSGERDAKSLSLLREEPSMSSNTGKPTLKQKVIKFIATKFEIVRGILLNAEEFAGKNVLDKIGIGIFLTGIAFFVGIAIEYEWINQAGRVFFGLILASVLLSLGYLLRTKFEKFSSVLIGGGVSAIILTVFAAFYQYEIIGVIPSFLILVFLVALAVLLSIKYDRSEITIIVFLAGFISPFTVSFDTGDYIILFSYLLLLNFGVLFYDFYKKSFVINIISYAFTFLFYALWLILEFNKGNDVPAFTAFAFLTVFYIMIFIMMIINNIKENRKFMPMEFSSLVFGTAMYYVAGLTIIAKTGADYKGLFTGWIAIVNFTYVLILYNRKNYDRNILHLFMAISIMFFGLIIPVQFVGNSVTLLWALQSVLLLFVSQKTKIPAMKLSSVGLTIGMLASLSIDLYRTYISTTGDLVAVTPIINKGFLTSIVALIAMSINLYLLKYEEKPYIVLPFIKINVYKAILGSFALSTFYFALRFEMKYAIIQHVDYVATVDSYIGIYNFAFIALLMLLSLIKDMKALHLANTILAVYGLALFLFFYNSVFTDIRNAYLLTTDVSLYQFRFHYIAALLIFAILVIGFRSTIKLLEKENVWSYLSALVFIFGTVFLLSSEIDHIFALSLYHPNMLIQDILSKTHRLPFTLVWTVGSLLFIIIGFLLKHKGIRILAMGLYLASLIKLFAFDYKYLTNQDLMVAFLTMGAVMLIASFIFQNFINIIKNKNVETNKVETIENQFDGRQ